jgi:hypothetical protein
MIVNETYINIHKIITSRYVLSWDENILLNCERYFNLFNKRILIERRFNPLAPELFLNFCTFCIENVNNTEPNEVEL